MSEALTPRQRQVLELRASGMSVPEAARAMGIAESTAKQHSQAALNALGVGTLVEALGAAGITAGSAAPRGNRSDAMPPIRVDVPVGGDLVATVTVRLRSVPR